MALLIYFQHWFQNSPMHECFCAHVAFQVKLALVEAPNPPPPPPPPPPTWFFFSHSVLPHFPRVHFHRFSWESPQWSEKTTFTPIFFVGWIGSYTVHSVCYLLPALHPWQHEHQSKTSVCHGQPEKKPLQPLLM